MTAFKTAVNNTPDYSARTANGAVTLRSSLNKCVDLFFTIGATRKTPAAAVPMFHAAFAENPETATRILLWSRDAREGAGERATFRAIIKDLSSLYAFDPFAASVIAKIPELGRWDDMLAFEGTRHEAAAFGALVRAVLSGDPLASKWAPRQGATAAKLRKLAGLTPKNWRKTLVTQSNTVEQKLCAKKFDAIDYNHVPSIAAHRYQATFARHDTSGNYATWKSNLEKVALGELPATAAKVNASVIMPHQIVQGLRLRTTNQTVATAQWEALPNFLGDSGNILPVVDTSSSMTAIVSGSTSALDVSVGVGLYLADKQTGPFKDMFCTFSGSSDICELRGNIAQKVLQLSTATWGMNTNLQAAFSKILNIGLQNSISNADMPKYLLVISDMEFDNCASLTNLELLEVQYRAAGYDMPLVVFWNVNGRPGNVPATASHKNVALVSGFSPSIMRAVLAADVQEFTPEGVMLRAVNRPRYDL